LKRKLKTEQSRFARLPFVVNLNYYQKKFDALDRKRHKNNGDWSEIAFLKGEVSRIRRGKPFRKGLVRINGLKRAINKCYGDLKNIDERSAVFDKKPNAHRILHVHKAKIRKEEYNGNSEEVRKAKRLLDFYGDGDVKFTVTL